jgi:hypothetical protein
LYLTATYDTSAKIAQRGTVLCQNTECDLIIGIEHGCLKTS